jgi:hypothetical protein
MKIYSSKKTKSNREKLNFNFTLLLKIQNHGTISILTLFLCSFLSY